MNPLPEDDLLTMAGLQSLFSHLPGGESIYRSLYSDREQDRLDARAPQPGDANNEAR